MDPNGDGHPGDGIDGWRLDVPNEIPPAFWIEWCALVRSINPEAYITGEIWDRADAWLDNKRFDAVMNYPFARAAVAWIFDRERKITASAFDRRLAELRLAYADNTAFVLQNLIDSHDTDRVASMAMNPDRDYDHDNRVQDSNPNYHNEKPSPEAYARARLVALLQMTYVGAPMIYYGDEVGMWGADDPTCRKPMLWEDLQPYDQPADNHVMTRHLAWYKSVIKLRNEYEALCVGSFRTVLADDDKDVWVFERSTSSERLWVALNASSHHAEIALPAAASEPWKRVFAGGGLDATIDSQTRPLSAEDGKLRVKVPAIGGVLLRAR
jgi:glycosidase